MSEESVTPQYFSGGDIKHLPGLLGIDVTSVSTGRVEAELEVTEKHLALNGYLHAGTIVTLADSSAGYGCMASLPEGASGFTTIELKSNHMATVTGASSSASPSAFTRAERRRCGNREYLQRRPKSCSPSLLARS